MLSDKRTAMSVAIAIIVGVTAIALVALAEYGTDDFLKVWAALGTLVALVGTLGAYIAKDREVAEKNHQVAQKSQQAAEKNLALMEVAHRASGSTGVDWNELSSYPIIARATYDWPSDWESSGGWTASETSPGDEVEPQASEPGSVGFGAAAAAQDKAYEDARKAREKRRESERQGSDAPGT